MSDDFGKLNVQKGPIKSFGCMKRFDLSPQGQQCWEWPDGRVSIFKMATAEPYAAKLPSLLRKLGGTSKAGTFYGFRDLEAIRIGLRNLPLREDEDLNLRY